MKRLFMALAVTLTLFTFFTGQVRGGENFGAADWGMSPEQVKNSETSDRLTGEMPGVLTYDGEIAGIKASIFYIFDDGKLNRGLYSVEGQQDAIIKDYETIKAFLLKQYGEPAEVKMGPEDEMDYGELDPAKPDDLYTLVLRKSVSPETIWKEGDTRIYLRLIEQDGRVAVMVDYIIFPAGK